MKKKEKRNADIDGVEPSTILRREKRFNILRREH
jgi:hypothetical protein